MFCNKCHKKIDTDDSFCSHCGSVVGEKGRELRKKPKNSKIQSTVNRIIFGGIKLVLLVFAVAVTCYGFYLAIVYVDGDIGEEMTALSELGPMMEPVGYFDDMDLFDADISNEEWFTHVHYTEPDAVPSGDANNTFASVVKIICEDGDYIYYGSGTNLDAAGYVLTNYHVVEDLKEDACMVGFADPASGLITEAYWTTIITDTEDETGHDLAYLSINEPVFDQEGNLYGYYDKISERTFPYFDQTDECTDSAIQLGEELLILGYPPLSGGSLTVTNGLVSSLYSPDGYIITSAKIISGNSGGLAVTREGCYVGVPTAVYFDEETDDEVFGEIIDSEFVLEFDEAIENDLQRYYEANGISD